MPNVLTKGLYTPPFVTETDEPPPWIDCTFSAGLMLWLKATLGGVPHDRNEREQLRIASGDVVGGSSLYDLKRGIANRYHKTVVLAPFSGASAQQRLARGDGMVIQGIYAALPAHYTRFDPGFAAQGDKSAHAMYFQGHDSKGYQHLDATKTMVVDAYVMDPLGRGSYDGEWISWAAVVQYARAFWQSVYLSALSLRQGQFK